MIRAIARHAYRTALFTLLILGAAQWANAENPEVQRHLTAALRFYEDLEYERALEQLARAKNFPHDVTVDVSIALYEGIILADMGRRNDSLAAFKTALVLRPNSQLPLKVAPKVKRDFESVRAEVSKELALSSAAPQADPKEPAMDRPELEKPQQIVPSEPAAVREPYSPGFGQWLRPYKKPAYFGLGGAGVAAAGLGLYFGAQSNSQAKSANTASSKQDGLSHLQKANSDATIANVLFATAAVLVSGGAAAFFLIPNDPPPNR